MPRQTLRRRFVGDVRDEIKRIAVQQLTTGGPSAVSINAIGRELGVSGPAMYRYFGGRDELLTALILDAYTDLAAATRTAVATRRTPRTRLAAFVAGYRRWAIANPHRYRLLFRAPLPGYDPNSEDLVVASQAAMNVLLDAVHGLDEPGPRASAGVQEWLVRRGRAADAPLAHRALTTWTRLHGLVSVEIEGGFESMGIDPDALYASELTP